METNFFQIFAALKFANILTSVYQYKQIVKRLNLSVKSKICKMMVKLLFKVDSESYSYIKTSFIKKTKSLKKNIR